MTAYALVTGTLFRSPEQRTSKAGKPYVTATIKAKDGDAFQFWRMTAFSDSAQAELMRLTDGDAVSVQGALKAEIYEKAGGETRLSLSVIAEHVLALHQPWKPREPDSDRTPPRERCAATDRPFDDPIPY
jgi:single-stranded DNA-binding protein